MPKLYRTNDSTGLTYSGSETSLPLILFVVFLVLKLTGSIDWSWWWVTAPLWMAVGLALVFFLGLAAFITFFSDR